VNLAAELRRLVNGYQASQAIHVAAVLGIADLLAGGARDAADLAAATGADAGALYRLLRALASLGVLHEDEGGRFSLTALGDGLRSDAEAPIGGWAAMIGRPYHWQAWGDLLHSVRTGENAFRHVNGTDPWTYRAAHGAGSQKTADTDTRLDHLRVSVTRCPARVLPTARTLARPFAKRASVRARARTCQCWTSPVQRPVQLARARAPVAAWRTVTVIEIRSPRVQPIGPVERTSAPPCV
jgi:hypothetical protein